ncbi:MAG: FprA family A-type flavoprotein [Bacteroidales bacterium]
MSDHSVLRISEHVHWVGVLDYDIVTFDIVMETQYGTTYNAYLINGEKKALVETVKDAFHETFFEKIANVTDVTTIDYVILNHTEPDHSGSLKYLLEKVPGIIVVGSGQAINYLQEMTGKPFKSMKVKDGDTLSLGNLTLRFIGAPNLHWPDSMYTFLEEEGILFTCDSFGAHFCHEAVFNDLTGPYDDAFKYYFDVILKPFSKFMLKAIEKIRPLDIKTICPGHGPVLRKDWKKFVDLSAQWSEEYLKTIASGVKHVLITYVSAYGYTGEMARHIARGILDSSSDFTVEVIDIEKMLPGEMEEKLVRSQALLVGSPTINQNTLLPVYRLFSVVNPIRDKGKLAAAFGSYGWSGEAVKLITGHLRNLKFNVPFEGMAAKFFPTNGKANDFYEFGKKFGETLLTLKAVQQDE